MKRAAAGVACITAALNGVYASPNKNDEHRNKAIASMGNAMTDAVHDAIQSAVHKVHEAHQKVPVKISEAKVEPHVLAQQSSLRGSTKVDQNPWEPVKPLRIMDNDLTPVAPMDRITPGIEAQHGGLMPPGYYPRVVNYIKDEARPNPFPQTYHDPVPKPPENYLVCKTSPDEWVDRKGFNCQYYETAQWCNGDGSYGPQWVKSYGKFADFAVRDVGAGQACCQCGGGARMQVVGDKTGSDRLEDKHLLAPPDRLPDPSARWFERNNGHFNVPERPLRKNQAPEDAVPMPYRQMAPLDSVEMKYSRYLNELHEQKTKDNPRGFSVRYYNVPPPSCGPDVAPPVGSSLDLSLDYTGSAASLLAVNTSTEYNPVYMTRKSLQWPTKKQPVGGVWWAKWSGSLMVLSPGKYTFNLDLGFNSNSWLKVDGMSVLTDGQCIVSQDKGVCEAKGCKWDKDNGNCAAHGKKAKKAAKGPGCKKGKYRSSPIIFGKKARGGEVDVIINPAGATTVLTVPAGVKDFQLTIHSAIGADLQIQDKSTDDWVVKFNGGIVNNQQREGTYHGLAVSFSGNNPASESAKLFGVTKSKMEVTLMSYSANPAAVKIVWSHQGGAEGGCDALDKGKATTKSLEWASNLIGRYQTCQHAWKAVAKAYPGGQISWSQWESVWSLAWGQNTAAGEAGGAKAWQMGFATTDSDNDQYVSETEFLKGCSKGQGGPSPAPAPLEMPKKAGKNQDVELKNCLTVKIMDKDSWPKKAFKGTGFKDHEVLGQLIGSPVSVEENKPKGVMVKSPDGKAKWFYPEGTFYCVQATAGKIDSTSRKTPPEYVSSGGPAPSIANIVPQIVGGAPAPGGLHTLALLAPRAFVDLEHDLEEDLPASLENSIELLAGAHCIEAMVMVTPSARDLALKYTGADTHDKEVTVPGQLMHCDPVIAACTTPLRDVCLNYKNEKCESAPGPAPAPAPASSD